MDISELFTSAIKGDIDNKTIGQKVLAILFGQTQEAIKSIRNNNGNNNNF